jgi:hypothetical protein
MSKQAYTAPRRNEQGVYLLYEGQQLGRSREYVYSRWRHGGWYVDNVHYPSGAVGCVSRNYGDRKWRIACDERRRTGTNVPPSQVVDHTYRTRDEAATAERRLIEAMGASA